MTMYGRGNFPEVKLQAQEVTKRQTHIFYSLFCWFILFSFQSKEHWTQENSSTLFFAPFYSAGEHNTSLMQFLKDCQKAVFCNKINDTQLEEKEYRKWFQ